MHSEQLVQLGIEDCHVRKTVFRKIGEASMDQLAHSGWHIGIVQVNGLHMKLLVQLIAQGFIRVAPGEGLAV